MVLGDDQKYLAALIFPNIDNVQAELVKRGRSRVDPRTFSTDPQVERLFDERIQHQLSELSHHEQVRRFVLLDRGFSVEAGHLTPKASLRRDAIARDFADEISQLFS
jgi:long-chain acyl-CoA synthetase